MTDELATWLREQIEARKAIAVAACEGGDGAWIRERREPGAYLKDADGEIVVYDEGAPTDAQFAHMEANDPRDVVARCEAELAILDEHPELQGFDGNQLDGPICGICSWSTNAGDTEGDPYPCLTIRLLGSGYKHRPGYREEWRT